MFAQTLLSQIQFPVFKERYLNQQQQNEIYEK